MASLQERTTVIIIKDADPLCVETLILTKDSPVFQYLLDECKYEEQDMSDFSSDAVGVFITLLDEGCMNDIDDGLFREVNKMAIVFEVSWLMENCKKWVGEKISAAKSDEQKSFLFEESYYMLKRLKKKSYMDMFVNQFGGSVNKLIISKYLADFENIDTEMIFPLLQLGGSNSEIFLKVLSDSIPRNSQLSEKALQLLQNINLNVCFQADREQWSILFDNIADLPGISVENLRITRKLETEVLRVAGMKKESTMKQTLLYDSQEWYRFFHFSPSTNNNWRSRRNNSSTLQNCVTAVSEGITSSMVEVVTYIALKMHSPTQEDEVDQFISDMEKLCLEKKLKRIPWHIIDLFISTLRYSSKGCAKNFVSLLKRIRQNTVLSSSNRENIVISRSRRVKVDEDEYGYEYKNIYTFEHPGSKRCKHRNCGFIIQHRYKIDDYIYRNTLKLVTDDDYYAGTGVHYHDVISASDICKYGVITLTITRPDDTKVQLDTVKLPGLKGWWHKWLPDADSNVQLKGSYVSYNISEYMVAKQNGK